MNHLRFSYYTGNAAMSISFAPAESFRLVELRVHLSAAGGAGNFTLDCDANQGSPFDLNLVTQDFTAVQNFIFQPDIPMSFESADKLILAYANANNRIYGLTIIWEAI